MRQGLKLISKASRTSFACCVLWQYHRPGMSHQAEFGYPEWGDKPTMQLPNGMPCSWNTVVMWTDNKDDTDNWHHEQATICFTPHHISLHLAPLYASAMY